MPTIPFVEVSHLPSAASFYAAVSQPLGIYFLQHTSGSSLDFGLPASPNLPCEVLFTLCESKKPQRSLLKFRAASQATVNEFHWRALQANSHEIPSNYLLKHTIEESIAQITDLDGNMLEARFDRQNSVPFSSVSTSRESRRVLEWQRNVARSLSDDASISSSSSNPRKVQARLRSSSPRDKDRDQQPPQLQRRETIAALPLRPKEEQKDPGSSILGGMSNQALMGTLLGAAAGAAVAYAMVKSEEPKQSEPVRPKLVSHNTSPSPVLSRVREVEGTAEAKSVVSVSRTGSEAKISKESRPEVKYSIAGKSGLGEIDEKKSVSHRAQEPELSQTRESEERREGSEISKSSKRTSKGSKHREHHTETSSAGGRSGNGRSDKSDREGDSRSKSRSKDKSEAKSHSSYVSARSEIKSHRSHASARSEASTVKPKERARSKLTTTLTVSNKEAVDRASQKSSQRDSVLSAREIPLPESTYTVISARHYALPESIATMSVAPSDSISSIGMKRERARRGM